VPLFVDRLAVTSIKRLHPDVVAAVYGRALFSVEEEKLLSSIPSVSHLLGMQ
jgi:N-terminal region of micro-spherule protein